MILEAFLMGALFLQPAATAGAAVVENIPAPSPNTIVSRVIPATLPVASALSIPASVKLRPAAVAPLLPEAALPAPSASAATLALAAPAEAAPGVGAIRATDARRGGSRAALALAALTGLYRGDYAARARTWDAAQESVWQRYMETPRDHPFVVDIDGPTGAGKNVFGGQLKDMFQERLGPSAAVWHEDEDDYAHPEGGFFALSSLRDEIKNDRPDVVFFSRSGFTDYGEIIARQADLYISLRPSELMRQKNMIKRTALYSWQHRSEFMEATGIWMHYIGATLLTPLIVAGDRARFVKQNLFPANGQYPDLFVLDSFSQRVRAFLSRPRRK